MDANLNSEEWNYNEHSKFTHSPTIYLNYSAKDGLLRDFEKLKEIEHLTDSIDIHLNTVNKQLTLKSDSTIEDLKELVDYYVGTEIEFDQLPFEQLYVSTEAALIWGNQLFRTFDEYIGFSPENLFKLNEEFFNDNNLIVAGKDRSGSLEIRAVDRVFFSKQGVLEIAINSYSLSDEFTEDIQYWTVAISVKKTIVECVELIIVDYHVTYGNGYCSDIPFHNSKDSET